MAYQRLASTLFCLLMLSLFINPAVAAAPLQRRATQSGPIRGVPNDLWADIVLGKPDFSGMVPNEVTGSRVFNPGGVVIDRSVTPNRMYVYDGSNSRVLGLHVNNQSGRRAELVLGQPGLDGYSGCNGDGNFQLYPQRAPASASTLCSMPETQVSPREGGSFANMAVDAHGNLYVPDFDNHRILLYNSPFDTDTVADDVWGQADFSGNKCNRNNPSYPAASTLCLRSSTNSGFVGGVGLDSANNLWVADNANNRVLRFPYDAATGHAGHVANLVLGQPGFTTGTYGQTLQQMWAPAAVRVSKTGSVYVADSHNNRILIFNPPFSNGKAASSTLGSNLLNPTSIEFDQDNNIWVSDSAHNQLLRFTPAKVIDRVLFKDVPRYEKSCGGDYSSDGPDFHFPGPDLNQNSAIFCDSRGSIGIDSDGNVWATGSGSSQDVRRYPAPFPIPQQGLAHAADVQVFQGYTPGEANAITERGLSDPRGIATWEDQLIISDGGRILFWNNAPDSLTNGKAADGVIIAPNFNTALDSPTGEIKVDGQNRLWVLSSDTISVYHLPLLTGAMPFYTLRPPVMVRASIVWNPNLDIAGMIVTDNGDYLWLSDPDNHRVIRIADPLTNPVVDVVLGQLNVMENQCNQGRGLDQPSANSLCFPGGIAMDRNGNIYVADFALEDRGNNRLLEYDAKLFPPTPASTLFGIPASRVYGTKEDFTIRGCLETTIDPLCKPFEPAFSHTGKMVVGLNGYSGQHFPLVYQNPLNNHMPVETLKDYYSMPSAVYYDSADNLYVADRNHGRVLIYRADLKTISGNAGMADATITYNDGRLRSIITDKNGDYILAVPTGWSGAIKPSKPGWSFTPDHIDYVAVSSDQTDQNYDALRSGYVISGNAGVSGITLSYNNGGPKTTVTDINRNYTIVVPPGWSGSITPSGKEVSYTPSSRSYFHISADQQNQNYTYQNPVLRFTSIGAQDGWLLEASEYAGVAGTLNAQSPTIRVGDDASRRQYYTILSFNTSALPDTAIIEKVILKLTKKSIAGNPAKLASLGGLLINVQGSAFGRPALELADIKSPNLSLFGPYRVNPANTFYTFNLTSFNTPINKSSRASGLTQLRMMFKLDDNNDSVANYIDLFSGNAANPAYRPQLIITYSMR